MGIQKSCLYKVISKLGSKLSMRQRVIATASVFFRRFYLKNSYCETDPFIVLAACFYLATKAEESPVHIKNVIAEARSIFSGYIFLFDFCYTSRRDRWDDVCSP